VNIVVMDKKVVAIVEDDPMRDLLGLGRALQIDWEENSSISAALPVRRDVIGAAHDGIKQASIEHPLRHPCGVGERHRVNQGGTALDIVDAGP
jgi:hypothetical protein